MRRPISLHPRLFHHVERLNEQCAVQNLYCVLTFLFILRRFVDVNFDFILKVSKSYSKSLVLFQKLCEFDFFINNTWTTACDSHSGLNIYVANVSRIACFFRSKAFELFSDWEWERLLRKSIKVEFIDFWNNLHLYMKQEIYLKNIFKKCLRYLIENLLFMQKKKLDFGRWQNWPEDWRTWTLICIQDPND